MEIFVNEMADANSLYKQANKYGMGGGGNKHNQPGKGNRDHTRDKDHTRDNRAGRDKQFGKGKAVGKGDSHANTAKNPTKGGKNTAIDWTTIFNKDRCKYCGKLSEWHKDKSTKAIVPCTWKDDNKANKEDLPWSKSKQGQYFMRVHNSHTLKIPKRGKHIHLCSVCETDDNLVQLYEQSNRPILIISLLSPQGKTRTVKALLDTGATKDYISLEVASWLRANGSIEKSNNKKLIGSGFRNICSSCTSSVDIEANLYGSEL
jgi:hypothetical protein